ncbi:hypothetical protein GCM10009621_20920 [Corynebacterium felinum]
MVEKANELISVPNPMPAFLIAPISPNQVCMFLFCEARLTKPRLLVQNMCDPACANSWLATINKTLSDTQRHMRYPNPVMTSPSIATLRGPMRFSALPITAGTSAAIVRPAVIATPIVARPTDVVRSK